MCVDVSVCLLFLQLRGLDPVSAARSHIDADLLKHDARGTYTYGMDIEVEGVQVTHTHNKHGRTGRGCGRQASRVSSPPPSLLQSPVEVQEQQSILTSRLYESTRFLVVHIILRVAPEHATSITVFVKVHTRSTGTATQHDTTRQLHMRGCLGTQHTVDVHVCILCVSVRRP